MRKKFIAGAAVLALLMNSPQVSADDHIVIFGGEFDNESAQSKPTEKPAKEPKPAEKPAPPPTKPEVKQPQVKTPPKPEVPPPIKKVEPPAQNQPQVEQRIEESADVERPFAQPTEISGGQERINDPVVTVPPPINKPAPITIEPPLNQPDNQSENQSINQPPQSYSRPRQTAPPKTLKTLKPRFIKLAVDDTYIYYLDKNSVQWKRMPYSSSEYIADVWIRLVERTPKELDGDMEAYGSDNYSAEVSLARDQGYQYAPEDLTVLRSQAYVLEHYYLRPKTKQVQFLCELEVFGRPQNTINERAYDYKNWESLVPGSVESAVYEATIKIIGKSKASERGHMTFSDMLDEYLRISL